MKKLFEHRIVGDIHEGMIIMFRDSSGAIRVLCKLTHSKEHTGDEWGFCGLYGGAPVYVTGSMRKSLSSAVLNHGNDIYQCESVHELIMEVLRDSKIHSLTINGIAQEIVVDESKLVSLVSGVLDVVSSIQSLGNEQVSDKLIRMYRDSLAELALPDDSSIRTILSKQRGEAMFTAKNPYEQVVVFDANPKEPIVLKYYFIAYRITNKLLNLDSVFNYVIDVSPMEWINTVCKTDDNKIINKRVLLWWTEISKEEADAWKVNTLSAQSKENK